MLDTLFGEGQSGLKILFFVIVVLALLALAFWLLRRFGAGRLGGGAARGRQPRLAVIDQATVDGRRRLVLIRRDNVEHLLIIGGPTDVAVAQNIVRAAKRHGGRSTRDGGKGWARRQRPSRQQRSSRQHASSPRCARKRGRRPR